MVRTCRERSRIGESGGAGMVELDTIQVRGVGAAGDEHLAIAEEGRGVTLARHAHRPRGRKSALKDAAQVKDFRSLRRARGDTCVEPPASNTLPHPGSSVAV